MFDNNTGIRKYNYRLELESVIDAVCNLAFDIGIQINNIAIKKENEIEYASQLFKDDFFDNLSLKKSDLTQMDGGDKYLFDKESFFSEISSYYNTIVFNIEPIVSFLEGSDVLLINKVDTYYFSLEDARGRIIASIKNGGILNHIISNIQDEKIRFSLEKINLFENDAFYKSTFNSEKQVSQPQLPYLELEYLREDLIKNELVEFEKYWLNNKKYLQKYKIDFSAVEDFYIVKDATNKNLGLLAGSIIIPFTDVDFTEYVKTERLIDFFWLLFERNYSVKITSNVRANDELVQEFQKIIKDPELNKLLSHLKNNLYVNDDSVIHDKYKVLFNRVLLLDNLDHLKDYDFLLSSNIEEETALGIYSKVKHGSSYNLIHWLNHEGIDDVRHYRGNEPIKKGKKHIYTLKPEISYYFLGKYFEDLVENILIENQIQYINNFNLKDKEFTCEVDFFIKGSDTLYYVETKTKLSKFYIEDFQKKASKMINFFQPILNKKIKIKFILLGGYSDNTVIDFQYFINAAEQETQLGYNTPRENLNTNPYFFNVPIPDKDGREITCIAEPEYDKLTQLILQICPK